MKHPTPQDLLRVPLFANLPADATEVLAASLDIEHFPAGRSLLIVGNSGYAFYVLDEGRVSATVAGQELRVMGPGDYFGEIAILGEGRRTATITAIEPVTAWKLFGTSFRELEMTRPDVAEALKEAMRQRLATGSR